jgi:phosphohistidine phosphatase SixA
LAHCQVAIPAEAHLARLSQTGSGVCSLYELEITFDQVLTNLGLASMPTDERERIRGELGIVMDRGLGEISGSRKLNPEGRLQSQDIAASLRSIAHHLQAASRPLRGRQTGLQQASHILVANRARELLAMNPEIGDSADAYLSDFCNQLDTVSHACTVAATVLKSNKSKGGRKPLNWFDDFTAVLVSIAKQNGIRPTIATDRSTGVAQGRFLDLAKGFERLLWLEMRSPSRAALAKRLSRALAELRKGRQAV